LFELFVCWCFGRYPLPPIVAAAPNSVSQVMILYEIRSLRVRYFGESIRCIMEAIDTWYHCHGQLQYVHINYINMYRCNKNKIATFFWCWSTVGPCGLGDRREVVIPCGNSAYGKKVWNESTCALGAVGLTTEHKTPFHIIDVVVVVKLYRTSTELILNCLMLVLEGERFEGGIAVFMDRLGTLWINV
jgi:hypothetical protein